MLVFLGGSGLVCLLLAQFWGFWQHRQWLQRLGWMAVAFFAILNLLAFIFAYSLTHFTPPGTFGIGLPRPVNSRLPSDFGLEYTTRRIRVNDREWLESWFIPASNTDSSKGTILLFPGQGGSKGKQLLAPAQVLHGLGYDALLVDFRGVGGSSGSTSTIGVLEAKDVALAVDYARELQQQLQRRSPIVLYGVSMGSAAILRAVSRENVTPDAIVLELPFSRLLDAVRVRLADRGIPTFPAAELIVFWGGIQQGFNGFAHNPIADARQVRVPTLVLHGEDDRWMSLAQIDELLAVFPGEKQLTIFPDAGHQLLVTVDRDLWGQSIDRFLNAVGEKF
ncbi:alpha/beta fold hydrolase [Oscillatoriales cyanobacterium LEGE 11467]|uniref:Alpha/beta fold hydrolase n=2 Tax=Zarconia TaxID=2992130 RepID=A0A928Z698_9CYAN|nr:alpha/beta fold hydrolase [Zarconia navalis LEGE 11467]